MEKVMSKKDVIVCRGIWYVMTLLSIFGISISLNLLWPPGGKSSSASRFLRDGAVSVTTFYAVTLLRYFFFGDPPYPCYKVITTEKERILQPMFSYLALKAVIISPLIQRVWMEEYSVSVSLFSISLFTGGIGLIQLSDKLRMEMRHALLTLFLGWFMCLSGICLCWVYSQDNQAIPYFTGLICQSALASGFYGYNVLVDQEGPLPVSY